MKRMYLKIARVKKDLTQEYVAKEIGVYSKHYGQIERGIVNLTWSTAIKLAEVLELDVTEMVMEETVIRKGE